MSRLLRRLVAGSLQLRRPCYNHETAVAPPTPELLDALYREEVKRALAMSPGDRLLEGPRLFARACRVMADGIRHRHPELDDDAVAARLRATVQRIRTLDRP